MKFCSFTISFVFICEIGCLVQGKKSRKNVIDVDYIDSIRNQAFDVLQSSGREAAYKLFQRVRELSPHDSNAALQLGLVDSQSKNDEIRERGFILLASVFDENAAPPLPDSENKIMLLNGILEYHKGKDRDDFEGMKSTLELMDQSSVYRQNHGDCSRLQLASLFPTTVSSAKSANEFMNSAEK